MQIVTKFREEIAQEIARVISQLNAPEDAAVVTMWTEEIDWVRGAEFEQLFLKKIQTIWDM